MATPQETLDQTVTARRVAELGLGLMLSKEEVTVDKLREAVDRVANDETIRQNVRQMQHLACEAGGYQRAVEEIMQFTQKLTSR
jgi:UDP:flavonoid glycosyltransferase YjiC (YdhE family)